MTNFVTIVDRAQCAAMYQLALVSPPGAFAEVGVYLGGSAEYLYRAALPQGRNLHLFDTFSGMPVYTPEYDTHKIGEFEPPAGTVGRIRSLMPLAELHIGVFPETCPPDLEPLALVHVDCDQYTSYKSVFEYLWPRLVFGGVMIFDDYPYLGGAKRAVEEHFDPSGLKTCYHRNYVVKGETPFRG